MKVALITPWDNAWAPMFKDVVERRGHEFALAKTTEGLEADVVIHGWTGRTQPVKGARNIMFLRRYELFDGGIGRVDWSGVDHLICVNTWIEQIARGVLRDNGHQTPVSTIYNAVDTRRWTYKERRPNYKVGMACHVHPKKNLPLALQILAALPDQYELHIAGDIQDGCTAEYLNHVGKRLRRKVYLYGHIDRQHLDLWWDQMGVCLSTSLSEGNPNNVIEAMAKGIKPVVHCWPGAEDQFDGYLFASVQEAAGLICSGTYASLDYRALVGQKFSIHNIERAVDVALQTEAECAS